MDSEIMVEALPLLGMCNLCLNEGAVKSMLIGHKHNGKSEVYAEMLLKCFTVDVSNTIINTIQTYSQQSYRRSDLSDLWHKPVKKKQKSNIFFKASSQF